MKIKAGCIAVVVTRWPSSTGQMFKPLLDQVFWMSLSKPRSHVTGHALHREAMLLCWGSQHKL